MDPLSTIAGALIAGAAAAAQEVVPQAVKDVYQGLKSLIIGKFGASSAVESAMRSVEKKPGDAARQEVLKDELADAGVAQDAEVFQRAQALLGLIRQHAPAIAQQYSASLTGDGCLAQGTGARATGAGGVIVEGGNTGSINTGTRIEASGAYIGGNVTAGRDFVGRDQINIYGGRSPDDRGIARRRDPREQKLYEAFEAVFSLDDLQDLAFTLGVDWDSLAGEAKGGKARALIDYFTKDGRFDVLYDAAKAKRPRYAW
ncbi:MAG: hypothetical protein RMN52_05215 [Anaerolineae bacterium]|nr:hypothetical protein [Candidatus Roseilinea sp.]MDW8449384.1 hypothetical protein [Anaerolineae bacterium]